MAVINRYSPYGAAHNEPKMIVVHAMGEHIKNANGGYDYAPDFLESQQFSAHALILPNGDVMRCRDDSAGAYHARGFNTDSLGMEILVPGMHDYRSFVKMIDHPYMFAKQYAAAVELCREWVRKWGITKIVRHSDLSPGRKVDPGSGFDFARFISDVQA